MPATLPVSPRFVRLLAALLILIGCIRVGLAAATLSQTFDEPAKVAFGMRLLALGKYPPEVHHPPLALTAAALGPYLAGVPFVEVREDVLGLGSFYSEGNALFYHGGNYRLNLALARFGIMPFFIALSVMVWRWARHSYGEGAGIVALVLVTTLPEVLAHSAIASDDLAIGATLTGACYALMRWIQSGTNRCAIALGTWSGLALASKMSAVIFLPAVVVAFIGWKLLCGGWSAVPAGTNRRRCLQGLFAFGIAALVLWATYFFDVRYLTTRGERPHSMIHPYVGESGFVHDAAYWLAENVPIPLGDYATGVMNLFVHNEGGHPAYLLGQYSASGWWGYFPVAFAAKTPVAFLVLSAVASFVLVGRSWKRREWTAALPVIAAALVMAIGMQSRINIGLRHVLPVYPALAVACAGVVSGLWSAGALWSRRIIRSVLVLLIGWQLASTAVVHPDYLAYFNELVPRPDAVLVDSNLDWGQDLFRLEDELRRRKVDSVWLDYFGTADLRRHDLPSWRKLRPGPPVSGWVAISETELKAVYYKDHHGYDWLNRYTPVARVGRSIRLYRIP